MERQSFNVKAFKGINKMHSRELGEMSRGKNFTVKNGALATRSGCSVVNKLASKAITSIHNATVAGVIPRVVVQVEDDLWVKIGDSWSKGYSSAQFNVLSGTTYDGNLILTGGRAVCYEIAENSIRRLLNYEMHADDPPPMDYTVVYRGVLFGWTHKSGYWDTLHFNGYETDSDGKIMARSPDYWPPDFAIKVLDETGGAIVSCVPMDSHMLILKERNYFTLYGDNEDNFSISPGGAVGAVSPWGAARVNDYAIWLNQDDLFYYRVYAYSGSKPFVISQPIEDLLNAVPFYQKTGNINDFNLDRIRAFGFGSKYWLFIPGHGTTIAFVYDALEGAWLYHEYPREFTCATMHEGQMLVGTSTGDVVVLDNSGSDFGEEIETEFVIGPLTMEGANEFKVRRIWFNAEPKNDFGLDVHISCDGGGERAARKDDVISTGGPAVEFTKGGQVTKAAKFQANADVWHKGRDIYVRVSTGDKINELQGFSLTAVQKPVK